MCITSFLTLRKNTEHYFFQMPRFCLIITHFSFMVLILRNNSTVTRAGFSPDIQLFRERLSEKMCTRQSRKVIWDMSNTLLLTPAPVAVESTFVAFLYHSQKYVLDLSCHSFKFLWRTVNSKPPTIPFRIVGCTFSYNLSRNSRIQVTVIKFKLQASYSQLSL